MGQALTEEGAEERGQRNCDRTLRNRAFGGRGVAKEEPKKKSEELRINPEENVFTSNAAKLGSYQAAGMAGTRIPSRR